MTPNRYPCLAFWLLCLMCGTSGFGQNLETLSVKKGVKASGSININTVGYYAHGIDQRRDPFNWFLTGNLNIDLFGYNAPFTFSYSNAGGNYSQPFNQFSFAPQYKWIKTYIGYNSMTFSNYTLAGHVFLGGGVELTPGKWKIAAMYGRFRKAVPFDLNDSLQHTNASFKRMGYGLKVGYEHNGDMVSVNIFSAKDDINSIPFVLAESQLSPQQNVAMSLNFHKKFFKRFFIEGEYAVSALNTDTRANTSEDDSTAFKPTHNLIKGLLPENATNRYFDALNASIGYNGNWYTMQVRFEQIAPEYQTLGAYYFNNDMRNITIIPSVRLFKNKLTVAANVGVQQNNLDKTRESTSERIVSSFNANLTPNELWNFTGSYSNFSSFTNLRAQQDPFFQNSLDTLDFYQVSQTSNVSVIRNLGVKERPQSIMLTLSHQQSKDKAEYQDKSNVSNFIMTNVGYSYSIVPSNLTLALAANYYTSNAARAKTSYWGPTLSVTKAMLEKKLRCSWTSSYNASSGNGTKTSPVLNNRISLSYTPKGKEENSGSPHALSLGINLTNRLKEVAEQPAYSELTGTLNYTYQF